MASSSCSYFSYSSMTFSIVLQAFVAAAFLLAASSAAPTPTAAATTQSVDVAYTLIIQEAEALRDQFRAVYNTYKTDRFGSDDVWAPELQIDGFLTTSNLPSNLQRRLMEEDALLPIHQEFLKTYKLVMTQLKGEESTAHGTASPFIGDYSVSIQLINRLLLKIEDLMEQQTIEDGTAPTFIDLQWLPANDQIHNVRSIYILQSINDYISSSINDYHMLKAKSQM